MRKRICALSVLIILAVSLCSCGLLPWVHYENAPDRWRHSWLYNDNYAVEEAVNELVAAADAGDREALKKMFAPNIYNQDGFDELLDDFLKAYPGGFSSESVDLSELYGASTGERQTDGGKNINTASNGAYIVLDGKYYSFYIRICYTNDFDPDEVGVTVFRIRSLSSAGEYSYLNKDDTRPLMCDVSSNYDARLLNVGMNSWLYIFDPELDRVYTKEEIVGAAEKCREEYGGEVPLSALTDRLGKPNGWDTTGSDPYDIDRAYILEPEDGEQQYAVLRVRDMKVTSIIVCREGLPDHIYQYDNIYDYIFKTKEGSS